MVTTKDGKGTETKRSLEEAQKLFRDLVQRTRDPSIEFWWVARLDKHGCTLECFHRDQIEDAQDRFVEFLRDPETRVSAAPHMDEADESEEVSEQA